MLDKIYRITEFFGWLESASEARVRVGFIAYSVPLLGDLTPLAATVATLVFELA